MEQNDQNPIVKVLTEEKFDEAFEQVIERMLTDSMVPLLMQNGLVHPFEIAMAMTELTGMMIQTNHEESHGPDCDCPKTPADVVTKLEAMLYKKIVEVGCGRFQAPEVREKIKMMLKTHRAQAREMAEKVQKSNAARFN